MSAAALIETGTEHRLADEESLKAMLEAVEMAEEDAMTTSELPTWIEVLFKRGLFSCSRSEHVQFNQDFLRKLVLETADAHENGRQQLQDACLRLLTSSDGKYVKGALSGLFVLGTAADVPAVEPLVHHPNEPIRKAATTCLFEIRRRPEGDPA